jgi:hypothetical protein
MTLVNLRPPILEQGFFFDGYYIYYNFLYSLAKMITPYRQAYTSYAGESWESIKNLIYNDMLIN